LKVVLQSLKTIVISERLGDSIDILLKDVPDAHRAGVRRDFRELTAPFIQWQ